MHGVALKNWVDMLCNIWTIILNPMDSCLFSGFSTVLEHDITGNGGGWVELPLMLPNGTSFGQFKDTSSNSIASGRFV